MHTTSLQYIQLYPTMKCNLSCSFCFNRKNDFIEDISISDFELLVNLFSDIGIKEVDILGGEPTLHPELNQMLCLLYIKKMKTMISTNGILVSSLKEISKRYNSDHIKIGVSINTNSINEELHNYIVTYKPFLKSICTKKRLISEGIEKYLLFSDIKIHLIFMDVLHKDDLKNSLPFYKYFQRLSYLKNFHKNINGVFCSGFIPDLENYPILQYVRCPAGTTKLSVMPDGSVYPCYLFFRNKEFKLGNIFIDDFKKIWQNPILDFFRRFEKNNCVNTKCNLFSVCHGGCPAVSFMISKNLNAPDPRCLN
ncbi:MAG: SPASM domain-containing protein [Thermodesulfovibrionales bacterium]